MRTISDDEAIEMIRKDEIEILIDLAGHTTGDRIPLFAKQPAPVQATWMGVPVITHEGSTQASRVGMSILSNVGLRENFLTNTIQLF
jgi:predicted O-linked N-acetylglucosamine transferase (SPINDLY family)